MGARVEEVKGAAACFTGGEGFGAGGWGGGELEWGECEWEWDWEWGWKWEWGGEWSAGAAEEGHEAAGDHRQEASEFGGGGCFGAEWSPDGMGGLRRDVYLLLGGLGWECPATD